MSYLHFEQGEIKEKGGLNTAMEIEGQPALWQDVFDLVLSQKEAIGSFLLPILANNDTRIILTGAGSSAFIGETIQGIVQETTGKIATAIATTDIITYPGQYFIKEIPTLLFSFARSGNSPESLAVVELANACCDTVFHFIITCNKEGALVQNPFPNTYHLILPENANDKGLAMTSSFTGMLLSAILVIKHKVMLSLKPALDLLITQANALLQNYLPQIRAVAEKPYQRVIFLGSGQLLGIARECHLKLQELTDGKVVCKHDSFLGFRHGPRAVINEESLIVYLFSGNEYVFLYERDLCVSIEADARNIPTLSYNRQLNDLKKSVLAVTFAPSAGAPGEFAFISATLIGQLLGFYHSLYLGIRPDTPSVSGAISRVVQGVTIYTALVPS